MRMTVVGLTGGIGSGKSTVAELFRECGATVVSGDAIARDLVVPGTPCLEQITAAFGDGVLRPDGTLDRAALAEIVFHDERALDALNAIMDEPIQIEIARQVSAATGHVVVESPLLLERDRAHTVDLVVVVLAPLDRRLAWLEARGVSVQDAMARIHTQVSDDARVAAADVVIVNDGGVEQLREQVQRVWSEFS